MPDKLLSDRVERLEKTVDDVRSETHSEFADLRREMRECFASARNDLQAGLANVTSELGRQIREAGEDDKRHWEMLFEEFFDRIAALGEHRHASPDR